MFIPDKQTIYAEWGRRGIYYPYAQSSLPDGVKLSDLLVQSLPFAYRDRTFLSCLRTWFVFNSEHVADSDIDIDIGRLSSLSSLDLIILLFLFNNIGHASLSDISTQIVGILDGRGVNKSVWKLFVVKTVHLTSRYLLVGIPFRPKIRARLLRLEISLNNRLIPAAESSIFATNAMFAQLDDFFASYGIVMAKTGLSPLKVGKMSDGQ